MLSVALLRWKMLLGFESLNTSTSRGKKYECLRFVNVN